MSGDTDVEFGMLMEAPYAYEAQLKGFGRALAAGMPPDRAAAACRLSREEVAGALGVLRKARRAARGAGRATVRTARKAVRVHPAALAARGAKFAGRGLAVATGPIRRRIFRAFFGKLVDRRARLLSWQQRRSLQPTTPERLLARKWAIKYVKGRGLLGRIVGSSLSGHVGAEPATTALLTASIPVIVDLVRRALKSAERQGAPSDPRTAGGPGNTEVPES